MATSDYLPALPGADTRQFLDARRREVLAAQAGGDTAGAVGATVRAAVQTPLVSAADYVNANVLPALDPAKRFAQGVLGMSAAAPQPTGATAALPATAAVPATAVPVVASGAASAAPSQEQIDIATRAGLLPRQGGGAGGVRTAAPAAASAAPAYVMDPINARKNAEYEWSKTHFGAMPTPSPAMQALTKLAESKGAADPLVTSVLLQTAHNEMERAAASKFANTFLVGAGGSEHERAAALSALPGLVHAAMAPRDIISPAATLAAENTRAQAQRDVEGTRSATQLAVEDKKAEAIKRNVQLGTMEVPNTDPATQAMHPTIKQSIYTVLDEKGVPKTYDIQGRQIKMPAPPAVGDAVAGAVDGVHTRADGTKVTVKSGKVTAVQQQPQ